MVLKYGSLVDITFNFKWVIVVELKGKGIFLQLDVKVIKKNS